MPVTSSGVVWFARLACVCWLLSRASPALAQLVINEIEYDETGTDTGEYIELKNNGSSVVDLAGYTLVFMNGANPASPVTYNNTFPALSGTIPAGGYFVICANAANTPNCNLDVSPNTDLIQNGPNDALVLRQSGADIDKLSYEGPLTGFGEGVGGAGTDSGSATPEGLSRCPDGSDSGDNAVDFLLKPNTPGAANSCGGGPVGPIGNCGEPATNIAAIQGSGATSGMLGASVVIEGVVVGDFQDGTLKGFWVQEEDSQQDGNPNTSDGILVFQNSFVGPVNAGSLVRVGGKVQEFDNVTEITDVSGIVVCAGTPVATARALTLPVTALTDLERFEGMLVEIAQPLTVTGNFQLGRFGSLDLSVGGRLFEATQLELPGAPAIAQIDLNNRSRIIFDDGSTAENPSPIPYLDVNRTRRVGDTLPSVTGVLDQRFSAYRIHPTTPPAFTSLPRPPVPDVPGRLHVVFANVLNYFTTIDDGAPHCGPAGTIDCRGANNANELMRQRRKLLNSLVELDADVVGLSEIENNTSAAISDLVAGLNAELGAGTYAFIDTGTIGTDAIKVGLLYKPAQVAPVGGFALLDSTVNPKFIDTKNRPVLAQTFRELTGGGRVVVAVHHLKSKGTPCTDISDPDTGDGQGNCNVTRRKAAEAIVEWFQSDPTHTGESNVLLIGDFNAYAKEDPIQTLLAGGYEGLAARFVGSGAYSYQFNGESGYLDDAFASPSLSSQVKGFAEWHSNADEPVALDYNTEFKVDDPFNISDPYRAADHDPLIIGLDLVSVSSSAVPALGAWQQQLWAAGLLALLGLAATRRRKQRE